MKILRSLHTVDSHTMGEPTRIVVGGVPNILGATMPEKKQYLIDHLDHLRTAIMLEPRGHSDMFGSIITPACSQNADFGIIFMDGGGYLNMCGHGSIGAATVAVETGIVEMVEPLTYVNMESPAGLVKAEVQVEDRTVKAVAITNVPSFLYKSDVTLELDGYGKVQFDIAFGGSFFAIVSAQSVGLKVEPQQNDKLKAFGVALRNKINSEMVVQHPTMPYINSVDLVEIYDTPTNPSANYKNVVIFGQGQLDRSPCGTGTSAKIATLYQKGLLMKNEAFIYESIAGTMFKGVVMEDTKVGEYDAIIPQITGSAYITGYNHLIIDEDDPLKYGFTL